MALPLFLVDPSGKPTTLPSEGADLQDLANRGYRGRLETDEEKAARLAQDHPIKSFAEGAAREASFGLLDPYIKHLNSGLISGAEVSQRMAARDETGAGTAGRVAGFGVGLLGGPMDVVGQLGGHAVAAVVAKGLARVVVRAGAESVPLLAGQLVSESTLTNQPITAEHVAKTAAVTVLAGGLLGGAAEKLSVAGLDSARKLSTTDFDAALRKVADSTDRAMFKRPLTDAELQLAREKGVIAGKATVSDESMGIHSQAVKAAVRDEGAPVLGILDKVAPPQVADVKGISEKIAKNAAKADLPEVEGAALRAAESTGYTAGPSSTFTMSGSGVSAGLPSWSELAALDRKVVAEGGESAYSHLLARAEARAPEGLDAQLASHAEQFETASGMAEKISESVGAARKTGATWSAADVMLGMHALSKGPTGIAELIAKKWAEPRWGFLASDVLGGAARFSLANRAAAGLAKRLEASAGAVGSGAFRVLLEDAAAHGSVAMLGEHARILQSSDAPEYMRAMGLQPEGPEGDSGERASAVNALASFSDAQGRMNDQHIDHFFGEGAGALQKPKPGSPSDFAQKMKAIQGVLLNPEAVHEALPRPLVGAAPATAGAATAAVVKACQLLSDAAPKDPYLGLPPALKRPWEPSPGDLAKWYRMLDAVQNPSAVIARAGTGAVSPEQVKVLKTVYPETFAELQQKVLERLGDQKTPLDQTRRSALLKLFGGPGISQAQMQQIQQIHGTVGGKQGGGPKPDGRQHVDAQENMETQGQRLERRQ